MPAPFAVRLAPHDPAWAGLASMESERLQAAIGSTVIAVHHIGSTAMPPIAAKPIVDLLLVVRDLGVLDVGRGAIEALGYRAHGEYGLPGRRYFTRDRGGVREVQLHAYADGDPAVRRHLAFRDHLRANPPLAAAYETEKRRCAALHPDDSHAYTDCKAAWIVRVEAEALAAI